MLSFGKGLQGSGARHINHAGMPVGGQKTSFRGPRVGHSIAKPTAPFDDFRCSRPSLYAKSRFFRARVVTCAPEIAASLTGLLPGIFLMISMVIANERWSVPEASLDIRLLSYTVASSGHSSPCLSIARPSVPLIFC